MLFILSCWSKILSQFHTAFSWKTFCKHPCSGTCYQWIFLDFIGPGQFWFLLHFWELFLLDILGWSVFFSLLSVFWRHHAMVLWLTCFLIRCLFVIIFAYLQYIFPLCLQDFVSLLLKQIEYDIIRYLLLLMMISLDALKLICENSLSLILANF